MPPLYVESVNNNNTNTSQSQGFNTTSILYKKHQLANTELWYSQTNPISIFGNTESIPIDMKNIKISLYHIADFIKNKNIKNNREEDIPSIVGFGQATWTFVS